MVKGKSCAQSNELLKTRNNDEMVIERRGYKVWFLIR